jgi:hypothetical protein
MPFREIESAVYAAGRARNMRPNMNTLTAKEGLSYPAPETARSKVSRWVRRVHMFTGLFLAPWMVMYALSTLVMAHREWVGSFYSSRNPAMVTERELDYSRSFPANLAREQIGRQLLQDLGLDGTHSVSGGRNGGPLVINRQHALTPQRITFDPSKGRVVIERQEFRTASFLERMHRRRGYNPYSLENTWGFAVDVTVVTMVFWSLSGIWLWWELRPLRLWGALSLVPGIILFALFAILI